MYTEIQPMGKTERVSAMVEGKDFDIEVDFSADGCATRITMKRLGECVLALTPAQLGILITAVTRLGVRLE